MPRTVHNLGQLEWTVAGWTPYLWRQQRSIESGSSHNAEVPAVPARVPGSVQLALLRAGIIPDWNAGLNARECEWVENRHWIFTTRLPDAWLSSGSNYRLRALGLDYAGWVLLNGREIGAFRGSFIPHQFDLTEALNPEGNVLQIVFDCPPRWLGQIGYTSQMTEWKPRFNYFWDWTARLVQIGIWDDLLLEVADGPYLSDLRAEAGWDVAKGTGTLRALGDVAHDAGARIVLSLEGEGDGGPLWESELGVEELRDGVMADDLPVEAWWPNGQGAQPLYTLRCRLLEKDGTELDEMARRVGFVDLRWERCEGAPAEADPWLCVVSDRPVFLQGVNWTPIRPNFADVPDDHYRRLLETYRDMGCTLLRVWGGAFLEKEIFYDLCDELGLLVWQEFPLSSSGLENWPPEEPTAIEEMAEIARSYVIRRRHHVSLLLWCGGNELLGPPQAHIPATLEHPMLARLAEVVEEHDPRRRFLPTSPSGPRFGADTQEFGKGLHWDVHGPWHVSGSIEGEWTEYWCNNDALFHSEVGVAGASDAELTRQYKGTLDEVPGTAENPLWRRTSWWIDWPRFVEEQGREPADLEEYVAWSQERQRAALAVAAAATKARFPRCGGFVIWMGHDSFPCTANTAIIDFEGNPKPAAEAIADVFRAI